MQRVRGRALAMCGDRHVSRALAVAAVCLLAVGALGGRGGARSSPTAIRVGDTVISERSVDHWTSIVTHGALAAQTKDAARQSPRQQALAFLIDAAWLDGEAERVGLRPSHSDIARIVTGQTGLSTSDLNTLAATLAKTGQTLADVEREARATWDGEMLARRLTATVDREARAQVGDREVASFYRAHIARYHLREQRFYDLHEQIATRARAAALARKFGSGARFSIRANKEKPFRPTSFDDLPGQAVVYRAVFAAKRTGVVVGPLPLQGRWCLFVLRRIVPARVQLLAEVRGAIERRLLASARRDVRARLLAAYRQRWVAHTDCRLGYVVPGCRQFRGARRSDGGSLADE
jgi:hypothetical protein